MKIKHFISDTCIIKCFSLFCFCLVSIQETTDSSSQVVLVIYCQYTCILFRHTPGTNISAQCLSFQFVFTAKYRF